MLDYAPATARGSVSTFPRRFVLLEGSGSTGQADYFCSQPTAAMVFNADVELTNDTAQQRAKPVEASLFRSLADEWKHATGHFSLEADKVGHRAYLRIIGMGREVAVPLILKELRDRGGFWYRALEALNEDNSPVRPEDKGNTRRMKAAWLQWGRDNGYIS